MKSRCGDGLLLLRWKKRCCCRGSGDWSATRNHGNKLPGDWVVVYESGWSHQKLLICNRWILEVSNGGHQRHKLPLLLSGWGDRRIRMPVTLLLILLMLMLCYCCCLLLLTVCGKNSVERRSYACMRILFLEYAETRLTRR